MGRALTRSSARTASRERTRRSGTSRAPATATIQGFSTDISVNVGGTIGFKIDTDASAYTIKIFRTGWYQGLGARKIATVTPSARLPQIQPQCVTDAATELYDCGNWGRLRLLGGAGHCGLRRVHRAPAPHRQRRTRATSPSSCADDASHSAVLFQTSDPTWQAYNTYGGSDFYQGAANGRAYKISYNRPVATRGDNDGRDFYFSNEYPTVRFLEKNGYDVSYFSGVDTDRTGCRLLKNHKVFLSVGHDEYWSAGAAGQRRGGERRRREPAVPLRQRGVLAHSLRAVGRRQQRPVPHAGLLQGDLGNAKIDPTAEWTGTWRDPRFASQANGGGLPENALTGTMYMSNNDRPPVTVSAAEGKLRLWRNTALASWPPAPTTALAAHTIGYESDEDLDNGFRPAGLIDLSTTTGRRRNTCRTSATPVAPGRRRTTSPSTVPRAARSCSRRQHPVGVGPRPDARRRRRPGRREDAAGPGQPPRRHGRPAGHPHLGAGRRDGEHRHHRTDRDHHHTGRREPRSPTARRSPSTGTASDVGGVVAGVEVSTDGGSTWHPATGTTTWTYNYVQHGVGAQTIQVRAIDDSGNYSSTPDERQLHGRRPVHRSSAPRSRPSPTPATPRRSSSG